MSRLRHDPARLQTIADPALFGRVAVLMGGDSAEREISLKSGSAVYSALCRRGVEAVCFDPHQKSLMQIKTQGIDRVWIALHGPGGEDGSVQGALDYLGVPYTGSGVLGSALCMDKLRTKQLAGAVGIATADSVLLKSPEDLPRALDRLGLPLIVKPSSQGSSVGMSTLMYLLKRGLQVPSTPWRYCKARRCPRFALRRPVAFTTTRPNISVTILDITAQAVCRLTLRII
jgi:hypothetical protein